MKYVLIAMIPVFLLSGCAQKSTVQETTEAKKETASLEEQTKEASMEVTAQMQEAVKIEQNELMPQVAIKPEVEITKLKQMAGSVTEKEEGGWGFSIYDPVAGEIGYYTSNGMLLGIEKK